MRTEWRGKNLVFFLCCVHSMELSKWLRLYRTHIELLKSGVVIQMFTFQ